MPNICKVWWATLASMLRWFWPNWEFCYENKTPGSDATKGGLSIGNVVEVDLEKKSQRAQPILTPKGLLRSKLANLLIGENGHRSTLNPVIYFIHDQQVLGAKRYPRARHEQTFR